jgi:hypothetical protein
MYVRIFIGFNFIGTLILQMTSKIYILDKIIVFEKKLDAIVGIQSSAKYHHANLIIKQGDLGHKWVRQKALCALQKHEISSRLV